MKKLVLMMLLVFAATVVSTAQNKKNQIPSADTINAISDTLTSKVMVENNSGNKAVNAEYSTNELISDLSDNIIPLTGIVFIFGMPVLIILIISIFQHKKRNAQYELIAKIIEAGKEIPEGFFQQDKPEIKNSFTKGVTNTFAGIGIAILLWNLVEIKFASIGLLISCIGIGQIIIYFVINKSKKNRNDKKTEECNQQPE